MKTISNEQRWYDKEAGQIKMWLEESRKSMIPYAPLGLAVSILECMKLRIVNNPALANFQNGIRYWAGRVNSESKRQGLEVTA